MKFAVVVFPGSNSDHDAFHAASRVLGEQASLVWHKDTDLGGADAVILPGGFAHGDYLRTGAIARFSPIMPAVKAFADAAGRCSASATASRCCSRPACCPARWCATIASSSCRASCRCASSRPTRRSRPRARRSRCCSMPIAHGEGNYFAPPDVLGAARGESPGGVPLHRCRRRGRRPSGTRTGRSTASPASAIAQRNVVGLMPHPERASRAVAGQRRRPRRAGVGGEGVVDLDSVRRLKADA